MTATRNGRRAGTEAAAGPEASPIGGEAWSVANQADLVAALDRVRRRVVRALAMPDGDAVAADRHELQPPEPAAAPIAANRGFGRYALGRLVERLGLSPFEADMLVLCAGVELSSAFAETVARARGLAEGQPVAATFGLGLAVLPEAHWSALAPDAPLRRWRLVELGGGGLTEAPLRIDERILHALTDVRTLDERLAPYVVARMDRPSRPGSAEDAGGRPSAELAASLRVNRIVQLVGGDRANRAEALHGAADLLGAASLLVTRGAVPDAAPDRLALARLLAREALLEGTIVGIDAGASGGPAGSIDDERLASFVEALSPARVVVLAPEPLPLAGARATVLALRAETSGQRLARWSTALGSSAEAVNGTLSAIAATFELPPEALAGVVGRALANPDRPSRLVADLWDGARAAARPRMDGLAQRIEAAAGWADVVLPPEQLRTLHAIALHVRNRHRVYEEWGFADASARGLGIAALFAGPSGTGKTMAAEVLARELRLDLYRIDLATVVSKYIGDTEKNLRRLFDAAEGSGAILLFDEADALFGKRSEIRDSHDRYANVEIGYLLQRMETYRGLAILTTNAKEALDQAFLRRLRFVVTFPFPDAASRAEIWRRVFPARTPTATLDPDRLAQLAVPGGQIRNIALGAAFLAADRNEAVSMGHLAEAARTEYAKHERQPSDAELRGWA